MKILFFIETLRSGGKERRLLELVRYLKENTNHEMVVVLTEEKIQYQYADKLDVAIKILKRGIKKDPILLYRFYRLCRSEKPDIIHTWGSMLAFYALPAVVLRKIPHINSQITNAPLRRKTSGFHYFITNLGFRFSDVILANSYAGLKSYGLSGDKCRVIYNGIRLDRFANLPGKEIIRSKYGINTAFAVIMVASYAKNKKYDLLTDVARIVNADRDDITFIGLGDTEDDRPEYERIKARASGIRNYILLPKSNEVESIVNACDIGVLFTYSEGISNAIIEYMACGKPVIASREGGTSEIITNGENGFLLSGETPEEISLMLTGLIDNKEKRMETGSRARKQIEDKFSIDSMGNEFCKLYSSVAEKIKR